MRLLHLWGHLVGMPLWDAESVEDRTRALRQVLSLAPEVMGEDGVLGYTHAEQGWRSSLSAHRLSVDILGHFRAGFVLLCVSEGRKN